MERMKKILFGALLLCAMTVWADVPCYSELEGLKGMQILDALQAKISDHTVLSYSSIWASNTGADDRGDGTNNIWDMYSDCVFSKYDKCSSGESTTNCECYNREHSVPKSWWGGSQDVPMYTDLHHVIPTDRLANSQRDAWPLGKVTNVEWTNGSSKLGYGTFGSSGNNKTFEPADEYKGDFARIYFYMATCYKGQNLAVAGKGYQVFTTAGLLTAKARQLYLEWHRQDPVSDKERARNKKVAQKQGNRNPYIDMPELVEYIWGNKSLVTYTCQGADIESVEESAPRAIKRIENGALYIELPDGTRYTTTGARMR